mmetsp:Transcript_9629/g.25955  ORF Transcript_9629/g.25955 Transcript_9629/m.25955 type:complete len:129 (-) Transcript_9629:51-437(-)
MTTLDEVGNGEDGEGRSLKPSLTRVPLREPDDGLEEEEREEGREGDGKSGGKGEKGKEGKGRQGTVRPRSPSIGLQPSSPPPHQQYLAGQVVSNIIIADDLSVYISCNSGLCTVWDIESGDCLVDFEG